MRQARVHRVKRGGKLHKYHRLTRAPLPADIPEDDPVFVEAWLAEERKISPKVLVTGVVDGSIAQAIDRFFDDPAALRDLSEKYRGILRRHLLAAAKGKERALLKDLEQKHIQADVDRLEGGVAQSRLKAWRFFLKWAKKAELIEKGPSLGIAKPKLAPSDGHIPWDEADVAKFRARWPIGTAPRAAMELLHWSGARVSDARKLTRSMVRGGLLSYKQTKTERQTKGNNEAHCPWDGPLPAFGQTMQADRDLMHAALAAFAPKALLILPTQDGKQRSAKGLSNTVNDAARDAGLLDRTAHGLRKTRLIALAEAGASAHQIQAWGGHASLKEIEDYTKAASRRKALLGVELPERDTQAG